MRGSQFTEAKLRRFKKLLGRRSGDAFDLAEDNPVAKEVRPVHQNRLSGSDIREKMKRFFRAPRSVRSDRALRSAQARDRIDRWLADLKEEARSLKKTDADFQDIDLLASELKSVTKALEEYEKLAELSFYDRHPLNELANFVSTVNYLSRVIGPMIGNRVKMTQVRARKSSKSQAKYRLVEEQARALRERNPNLSRRSMAHVLAPKVGLKPATLEKHFGKVFRTRKRR
jgi:hypothetical protein